PSSRAGRHRTPHALLGDTLGLPGPVLRNCRRAAHVECGGGTFGRVLANRVTSSHRFQTRSRTARARPSITVGKAVAPSFARGSIIPSVRHRTPHALLGGTLGLPGPVLHPVLEHHYRPERLGVVGFAGAVLGEEGGDARLVH